jgi:hypothetical protein
MREKNAARNECVNLVGRRFGRPDPPRGYPRRAILPSTRYTRAFSNDEADEIERWLAQEFESPAAGALERATTDARLSDDDYHRLIRLAAAQDVRTPARLLEIVQRGAAHTQAVMTETLDQTDSDGDGYGDACDSDADADGILNETDNCPITANAAQEDLDNDGLADLCDEDRDGDDDPNGPDKCPSKANSDQTDTSYDGVGDVAQRRPPPAPGSPISPIVILPDGTTSTVEMTFENVVSGGTTSIEAAATPGGGTGVTPPPSRPERRTCNKA